MENKLENEMEFYRVSPMDLGMLSISQINNPYMAKEAMERIAYCNSLAKLEGLGKNYIDVNDPKNLDMRIKEYLPTCTKTYKK